MSSMNKNLKNIYQFDIGNLLDSLSQNLELGESIELCRYIVKYLTKGGQFREREFLKSPIREYESQLVIRLEEETGTFSISLDYILYNFLTDLDAISIAARNVAKVIGREKFLHVVSDTLCETLEHDYEGRGYVDTDYEYLYNYLSGLFFDAV